MQIGTDLTSVELLSWGLDVNAGDEVLFPVSIDFDRDLLRAGKQTLNVPAGLIDNTFHKTSPPLMFHDLWRKNKSLKKNVKGSLRKNLAD